jgi:hypothetical protein
LIHQSASPLSFLGLQSFLKVLFHLRDVPAKFAWIDKGIWSARFLPKERTKMRFQ